MFRVKWGHGELAGMLVEHEFQAADMTAIDAFRVWRGSVVFDLALAGWALPGHDAAGFYGGTKSGIKKPRDE